MGTGPVERLRVERVSVHGVNAWVVGDDEECLLVDAPADPAALLAGVGDRRLRGILLTHAHLSHCAGALTVSDVTGAPIALSPDDYGLWRQTRHTGWPDRALVDGMVLEVAGAGLAAIHLPGHTDGSTCFYSRERGVLFAGDCLDRRGVLAAGVHEDPSGLVSGIRARLFTLPPDTQVCPGHGDTVRMGTLRWEMEFWG